MKAIMLYIAPIVTVISTVIAIIIGVQTIKKKQENVASKHDWRSYFFHNYKQNI